MYPGEFPLLVPAMTSLALGTALATRSSNASISISQRLYVPIFQKQESAARDCRDDQNPDIQAARQEFRERENGCSHRGTYQSGYDDTPAAARKLNWPSGSCA